MSAGMHAAISARRQELIDLAAALVRADTAQPTGDTTGAVRVLRAYFEAHGLATEVLAAVPDKPNLICVLDGGGPGRILGLNGHMDTLPAGDARQWSVPPLELTRRAGTLSGLGIGNMKAGLAGLAMATTELARVRADWRGRCVFSAVADEVLFGDHGAAWLLDAQPDLRGDALICGEGPGAMTLGVAEKGLLWLELAAAAPPGQGMLATQGSSPVVQLGRLLAHMDAWNTEQVAPPPGLMDLGRSAGAHRLRVSVNIGRIEGGALPSQVPATVRALVDVRVPPGLRIAEIEARVDACAAGLVGVTWRRLKGWDPSWTDPGAPVVAAVARAAGQVRGAAPVATVRLPASDAARWRARGVPAVCFGPQHGLVSGIDDFVQEQDMVDAAAIYAMAARDYLA